MTDKSFVGKPIGRNVWINPGSGPVSGANLDNAAQNIEKFVEDVGGIETTWTWPSSKEDEGRWLFNLKHDDREVEVEMPGIHLEEVRYLGREDQNIWDFPRLYVDGGSWVWKYGVDVARDILFGEKEED